MFLLFLLNRKIRAADKETKYLNYKKLNDLN